jgi:hypothetical protein
MTQSYEKECLYCKHTIIMSDETGKWLPYNKDDSAHDCRTIHSSRVLPLGYVCVPYAMWVYVRILFPLLVLTH